MKPLTNILALAALLLAGTLPGSAQETATIAKPGASALKYGLYIHFGVQTFAKPDEKGTIPPERFAPTSLDVKSWAHAAKEAGMTFAVLNIKHVNGFCLWDSKDYDYDVGSSAMKSDLMADFIAACNAEGIVPGASYLITDVLQEGSYRAKEPVLPVHFAVIKKQIIELHTRYPGLRLQIFEHSPRLSTAEWDELSGTVRKLNPECRILDVSREPRYFPAAVVKGNGWFWSPKAVITPTSQLLQSWQQCQAEKKALILSIGPDNSGRIPHNQLAVLAEMKTLIASNAAKPVFTPAAETKPDATKRLKEVKALFEQGLINKEDYDKKVKEIMESL